MDYAISHHTVFMPAGEYIRKYRDEDKFIVFCRRCNRYDRCWACPPYDFDISARIGKMAASSYGRFYAYPNTGFYQGQTERIQDFFQNRAEYMLYYVEHLEEIEDSWNAIEAPVQLQEPDEAQPQETLPQEEATDAGQEQSQAESAENVEQSGESDGQ